MFTLASAEEKRRENISVSEINFDIFISGLKFQPLDPQTRSLPQKGKIRFGENIGVIGSVGSGNLRF